MRSANYGVTQGHFAGAKERQESFDRSSEPMGNKDTNLKTGADKRFHFDLEEEDDMAMAD